MRPRHKKKIYFSRTPTLPSTLWLAAAQHRLRTHAVQRQFIVCLFWAHIWAHMCSHVSSRPSTSPASAPAPAIAMETMPNCKCEKNTISFWRRCNWGPPAARSPGYEIKIKTFNTRRETYKKNTDGSRNNTHTDAFTHTHTLDLYSKN